MVAKQHGVGSGLRLSEGLLLSLWLSAERWWSLADDVASSPRVAAECGWNPTCAREWSTAGVEAACTAGTYRTVMTTANADSVSAQAAITNSGWYRSASFLVSATSCAGKSR